MSLSAPYRQHNFMGLHVDDAAALVFIQAQHWDSLKNGAGVPEKGMLYYDSTLNAMKLYTGAWTTFGVGIPTLTQVLLAGNSAGATTINMNANKVTGLADGGVAGDAIGWGQAGAQLAGLACAGQRITGLGAPSASTDAATKAYVDQLIQGLAWQDEVLIRGVNVPPVGPGLGDRYIIGAAPAGAWVGHAEDIVEWDGAAWVFTPEREGLTAYVLSENSVYTWNGVSWVLMSSLFLFSLDMAYDAGGAGLGRAITANSGAVTITVPDASNNAALEITQNDITNNPVSLSITNAGTGTSVSLSGATQSILGDGNVSLATLANVAALRTLTIDAHNVNVGGTAQLQIDDYYRRLSTAGGGYSAAMPYSSAKADWDDFKTNFGDGTSLLAAINSCAAPPPPSTTLDDAYDNFGINPATITVDAKDVTWSPTGAYSFVVDTSACTGVADGFIVQDGTDNFQLLHKGANTLALATALGAVSLEGSDTYSLSMAANDAGPKTLTISAANAGAGSALLDVNAKGNITIDSSAGSIGIGVDAVNQAINIGTLGTRTISLGSAAATAVNMDAIALSLDASDNSNLTLAANAAGAKTLTLSVTNAGAGDGILDIDAKSAITIDSAAGGISLDCIGSSNFTMAGNSAGGLTFDILAGNAGAGAAALTVSNSKGTVALTATQVDPAATITISTARADVIITANSGTLNMDGSSVTIDAVSAISLDAAGASNFTVAGNDLTLSTTTSGTIAITSAGLIDIDAAANLDLDVTGTMQIDATSTSYITVKNAALSITTNTAGQLDITSAGLLVLCDAYKAASSFGTDLVLSDNAAEWTAFDTNFGEVSILNAISQCSPLSTGFFFAQNTDVDIATSPETVDTFTTATLGGATPVSGRVMWFWFAVGMSDSTNHVSGGTVAVSWDGDLTPHVNTTRDWADGAEITFSVTLANPGTDLVTVTLQATTTVDNYCVQVRRVPYFTAAATV